MMNRVKLPAKGFKDGSDGVKITRLEVRLGQQFEDCTEIFVRGRAIIHGAEERFSGVTVIREGRDVPEADLEYSGKPDEEMGRNLAVAIHLCLDHCDEGAGPDRFSVGAEMARICGDED